LDEGETGGISGPWIVKLSMAVEEEEEGEEENSLVFAAAAAALVVVGTIRSGWNADEDLGALLRMVAKNGIIVDTFIGALILDLVE